MTTSNTPLSAIQNQALVDHLVRRRHFHTCGQMIWIVDTPAGFLCYAELRPIMPAPITGCPRCGEALTRDALTQRQHAGASRGGRARGP
jgi:hypothetical protein